MNPKSEKNSYMTMGASSASSSMRTLTRVSSIRSGPDYRISGFHNHLGGYARTSTRMMATKKEAEDD
jgi:hypothetical protein